jgi:carboxymethylenebutenolidase
VHTTIAPASPSAAAMPRPAPRVAPATTATRPRSARPSGLQSIARVSRENRCVYPASAFSGILARVTPLQRYIAEEIATDHVDGLMSRREALRRLALLGVGTAAATALIAACGENKKPTSEAPATSTGAVTSSESASASAPPPGSDKTLPTEPITWSGPQGELQGAWAEAPNARGGVLVIHENKGLNDWVRSVAGRFAGIGYSALAIDLLSAQGGTAKFSDPAQATAALGNIPNDQFVANLKSGVGELQRRVPDKKVAAVGFCMGGGLVWQMLAASTPELAAAVPFYGPAPENPDFAGSKNAAVLAFYGALDDRVTKTEPVVRAALEKAGLVHDLVTEPDANHAFFNDTGDRYNAAAAADAWRRVQDWFGKYVV